jgi:non-ribosomal peptide synthetase component F
VELEGLIGCFITTLVIRARLDGLQSFRHLMRQCRDTCVAAFANQDVPFEHVVKAVCPERAHETTPLFRSMFAWHNGLPPSRDVGDLKWSITPLETGTALYDLEMTLFPDDGGIRGYLEYNADLFDATTVKNLMCCFGHLLEAVVDNPDLPLWPAPVLGNGCSTRPLNRAEETHT